jgi:DNA invertase Pin-like site-specific DNA recombinase
MSGSISDRPGWQDLLREAEKNGFDAIVVVKTDRITRSLKYAVCFYDWLIAHPAIKLVSTTTASTSRRRMGTSRSCSTAP